MRCKRQNLLLQTTSFTVNPLSASFTKWSNTLKQFGLLPMNCLSVFDHFVGLALKALTSNMIGVTMNFETQFHHT